MYKVSKILVPTDFSSCSQAALTHAQALASALGASIEVLYVVELPIFDKEPRVIGNQGPTSLRDYALETGQAALNAFLDDRQAAGVSRKVEAGRPRERILEYAKRGSFDLIVMGTHGRSGRAHSLAGSVAESVVRSAPCPVMTVQENPA